MPLQLELQKQHWNAVLHRDPRLDGLLVYGVNTTGIYCRPSCPSRLPRRENVSFFPTCSAAEAAGFRACKRCNPQSTAPTDIRAAIIERACRRIEAPEGEPRLGELAAEAELSPWHFHRLFKLVTGVTPKQYARAARMKRFRSTLTTAGSVTTAIYDAGYNSSSRAYEAAAERLGMTPTAFRSGSHGETIHYSLARCYLGWVLVAATERGICSIEFDASSDRLAKQLRSSFPQAEIKQAGREFAATIEKVIQFLDEPGRGLDLPLDIRGTAFQQKVWHALREIPAGQTRTYGDVAQMIGKPRATRAVARACAANKIAVAIPCHRIVRRDGDLSGYRWGVDRKNILLARETAKPTIERKTPRSRKKRLTGIRAN
ncbi:bifunctional DNA-binding transcriptional regulator/O6-methylguanine-DNA methyltransferase Ada [Bradyrhizobium sp. NP1]|uniref:bifunctional DNA-binding transcriptional regulator/O6-methylguanine-DNA methyltransferase Ada n=1 Tax=Bradyrhizobium sp. NP1 TaxID=3049772 RepID=UPI0025A54611|nr:bifunctional DNA-binding transcriptional regulator/O6-methylguanine-DNA methyltransferase Ada [Bradyrhizobium sp. NP1]WJR79226.1 bifunctional DNA-binding transcriptional regulator/O6-methylguanine-DNA methyltransferase Ada [Bradyrhizobium sp. NP1]